MDYLLDTNHWSAIQRQHPVLLDRISSLPQTTTLHMPVISQAELLVGVESLAEGRRKNELRSLYQELITQTTSILPIDSVVAEAFAELLCELKRSGRPIPTNDIWIAAIALAYDLTLVSSDKHFSQITDLRVEDWTSAPR